MWGCPQCNLYSPVVTRLMVQNYCSGSFILIFRGLLFSLPTENYYFADYFFCLFPHILSKPRQLYRLFLTSFPASHIISHLRFFTVAFYRFSSFCFFPHPTSPHLSFFPLPPPLRSCSHMPSSLTMKERRYFCPDIYFLLPCFLLTFSPLTSLLLPSC